MIFDGAKLSSSGYIVLFSCEGCLPHTIFICVGRDNVIICNKFIKSELDKTGIIIGYGSACNSESINDMGSMRSSNIQDALKNGFIRISLSPYNTQNDIKKLVRSLKELI